MKKHYADVLAHLAELERQIKPARMVTVTLPDGSEKRMTPLEFWKQRADFVHHEPGTGYRCQVSVDGVNDLMTSLALMDDETYRENGCVDIDEGSRRARETFLAVLFGSKAAEIIMNAEERQKGKTDE